MFAICIESSHKRGMGHLFRAINLIGYIQKKEEEAILFLNEDAPSLAVLEEQNIPYRMVDLEDKVSGWEAALIREYGITVWLNDRMDTKRETADHVKKTGIPLFSIDDLGEGAALCDGNFASLVFENQNHIPGKKVYVGVDYLILNPEIAKHQRRRKKLEKILVTLGGSDTYGVTPKVVMWLKEFLTTQEKSLHNKILVSVLLGPGAKIGKEVEALVENDSHFQILKNVSSLISLFGQFDLAITGGGVTGFEANASGLPCVVIANEKHEIQIGKYLQSLGGSLFAGYYQDMDLSKVRELTDKELEKMSALGMEKISLLGAERIYRIMKAAEMP